MYGGIMAETIKLEHNADGRGRRSGGRRLGISSIP